jgi:hypothetical protein
MSTVKGLLSKLFQKSTTEPVSSTPLSPPSSPTIGLKKIPEPQTTPTIQKYPIYERLYG